jgi:DNA-binding transcriptional ArsR family regulator
LYITLTLMTDREIRQITDSRVLAAMAHPLRRRLMDVLRVDGPATASLLSEHTGQAVGNISHHLHALAACDLIEQAPDLARDRRERWWRLVSAGTRWSSRDFGRDSAAEAVELAAASLNLDRQVGFVRAYAAADASERDWWGEGPFSTDSWLRLTPDELAELATSVIELFRQWSEREVPDDGQERRPVFAFARAVPATP